MNSNTCKNCPCFEPRPTLELWDGLCHLYPRHFAGNMTPPVPGSLDPYFIFSPHDNHDWCYQGRLIMEGEKS